MGGKGGGGTGWCQPVASAPLVRSPSPIAVSRIKVGGRGGQDVDRDIAKHPLGAAVRRDTLDDLMRTHVSSRSTLFTESVIREMTRLCQQHGGVNLAQGFPDFPAPEVIKEAAARAVREDVNQYAITWGAKRLRDAIVRKTQRFQGLDYDPETELTVCCGATECMAATSLFEPLGAEMMRRLLPASLARERSAKPSSSARCCGARPDEPRGTRKFMVCGCCETMMG